MALLIIFAHLHKCSTGVLLHIDNYSTLYKPDNKLKTIFCCRHDFTGTFQLPVLLKLSHGREILVRHSLCIEYNWRVVYILSVHLDLDIEVNKMFRFSCFFKSLQLNFIGVTVEKDRHYLHFSSTRHVFAPVPIGGFHPPKQVWLIYPYYLLFL